MQATADILRDQCERLVNLLFWGCPGERLPWACDPGEARVHGAASRHGRLVGSSVV